MLIALLIILVGFCAGFIFDVLHDGFERGDRAAHHSPLMLFEESGLAMSEAVVFEAIEFVMLHPHAEELNDFVEIGLELIELLADVFRFFFSDGLHDGYEVSHIRHERQLLYNSH